MINDHFLTGSDLLVYFNATLYMFWEREREIAVRDVIERCFIKWKSTEKTVKLNVVYEEKMFLHFGFNTYKKRRTVLVTILMNSGIYTRKILHVRLFE